jgi:hypothetical protein
MRITFRTHRFKARGLYKCEACGRRYQRTRTDFWSENPFHQWQDRQLELNAACKTKIHTALHTEECSRCHVANVPRVIEWMPM